MKSELGLRPGSDLTTDINRAVDLNPTRREETIRLETQSITKERLARFISTSTDVVNQANLAVEAKIKKSLVINDAGSIHEEKQKIALSLARNQLRKGVPEQYVDQFRIESTELERVISSGEYDVMIREIRSNWQEIKEKYRDQESTEISKDTFYSQLFSKLLAEKINNLIQSPLLGSITIDDADNFLRRIPPIKEDNSIAENIRTQKNPESNLVHAELYDRLKDPSGLDWRPLKQGLETDPSIESADILDLQNLRTINGNIKVEVEYCPLYQPGKLSESSLIINPQGLDSIINSRVGKKWIATEASLRLLKDHLRKNGRTLEVKATFADWAVLAGKNNDVNIEALAQQFDIYYKEIDRLCNRLGIPYRFQKMSDTLGAVLQAQGINQFVVAENSDIITDISHDGQNILRSLGFESLEISPESIEADKTIKDLIKGCEGKASLIKGLIGAYWVALPKLVEDCNMHLVMERSQNLLNLSTLGSNKKTTLNVLVK